MQCFGNYATKLRRENDATKFKHMKSKAHVFSTVSCILVNMFEIVDRVHCIKKISSIYLLSR